MSKARWERIKAVHSQAAEIKDRRKRAAFLRTECRGDLQLRAEVDSLLSQEGKRGILDAYSSLPGRSLLHYKVLERVGEGGMGLVYKAWDTRLERFVALKVLPPVFAADQESRGRLLQEARCLSALSHPNVVTVYDVEHDRGLDFIVLEYVRGRSLEYIVQGKRLSPGAALPYAIQIAEALAQAHDAGIIHRDLKPANILVTHEGTVKVIDFGLANKPGRPDGEGVSDGFLVGTVGYMSPEQARGKAGDARSDIFSFGTVLYWMLTGQRAYKQSSPEEMVRAAVNEPPLIPKKLPATLRRILTRTLELDPEARYPGAHELLVDLKAALATSLRPSRRRRGRSVATRFHIPAKQTVASAILLAASAFLMSPKPPSQDPVHAAQMWVLVTEGDKDRETDAYAELVVQSLRKAFGPNSLIGVRRVEAESRGVPTPVSQPSTPQPGVKVSLETRRESDDVLITSHVSVVGPAPVPVRQATHLTRVRLQDLGQTSSAGTTAENLRTMAQVVWGVHQFNTRSYDSAIESLGKALTMPSAAHEWIDPTIDRFIRGLALQGRVIAQGCEDASPTNCDVGRAIMDLRQSAADFQVILKGRPDHAGSHWHLGLAESGLCNLQSRSGEISAALRVCGSAIMHFGQALKTGRVYAGFFNALPEEARVLWNRGLTWMMRSRLPERDLQSTLADLASARKDFDQILGSETRHGAFLRNRRADLLRQRDRVIREEALLRDNNSGAPRGG